jgi:hypothetical protein
MKFELREDEKVLAEARGDHWIEFFYKYDRIPGRFYFTNERILFQDLSPIKSLRTNFEIEISDIREIKKCFIGPDIQYLPTGILVTLKNNKVHRISVLKRKQYIALLEELIKG